MTRKCYWDWESSRGNDGTISCRGTNKHCVIEFARLFYSLNKDKFIRCDKLSKLIHDEWCFMLYFDSQQLQIPPFIPVS